MTSKLIDSYYISFFFRDIKARFFFAEHGKKEKRGFKRIKLGEEAGG